MFLFLSFSLKEQRSATKDNVERRLARTVEELEGEEIDDEAEDVAVSDDSDDDQETVPYNPKNLPLGWDGKVGLIRFARLCLP